MKKKRPRGRPKKTYEHPGPGRPLKYQEEEGPMEPVSVRIPKKQIEKLREKAKRKHESLSDLIRESLSVFLDLFMLFLLVGIYLSLFPGGYISHPIYPIKMLAGGSIFSPMALVIIMILCIVALAISLILKMYLILNNRKKPKRPG